MKKVGSDRVLNAPCFRNKGDTSSSPLIRDLAFNRRYRQVNLVQVSKVSYYKLPWDNIQPSKEVSFQKVHGDEYVVFFHTVLAQCFQNNV